MAQSSKQKKAAAKARRKQRERTKEKEPSRVAKLMEQNGQLQMSLLNIRQMYDQKVLESQALQNALIQKDKLVTAIIVDRDPADFFVHLTAIEAVEDGEYAGYEVEEEELGYRFNAIMAEEVEEDEEE